MPIQERTPLWSGTLIDDKAFFVRIDVARRRGVFSYDEFDIGGLAGLWVGEEAESMSTRLASAIEQSNCWLPPYGLIATIYPSLGERPSWSGYHDLALAIG